MFTTKLTFDNKTLSLKPPWAKEPPEIPGEPSVETIEENECFFHDGYLEMVPTFLKLFLSLTLRLNGLPLKEFFGTTPSIHAMTL